MLSSARMAVLFALSAVLPAQLAAQPPSQDTSRIEISGDLAAGMMRHGPQVAIGATLSPRRSPIDVRFDLMLGVAPDHEVPGANFMAATAAAVWPVHIARSVTPYLLAGAVVSQSRHLAPAVGAVAGTGIRFSLGRVRPYLEGRVQQRVGPSFLLGLAF